MRQHRLDHGPGLPFALLLPLLVGFALVGVRGEIDPSVTAVILAATVIPAARLGGRLGGIGAALMAATVFDFAHTRAYGSLKIENANEVFLFIALLVVGLLVGSIAGNIVEVRNHEHDRYRASASVTRVLAVAHEGPVADVEAAVRAELMELLGLDDCSFVLDDPPLPVLEPLSELMPGADMADDGFTLPAAGVLVSVDAAGRHFGNLVCSPNPGVGVPAANRRNAVALGEVLGLALAARTSA